VGIEELFPPVWKDYINALNVSLVSPIYREDDLIWSFKPSGKYSPHLDYLEMMHETYDQPPP